MVYILFSYIFVGPQILNGLTNFEMSINIFYCLNFFYLKKFEHQFFQKSVFI